MAREDAPIHSTNLPIGLSPEAEVNVPSSEPEISDYSIAAFVESEGLSFPNLDLYDASCHDEDSDTLPSNITITHLQAAANKDKEPSLNDPLFGAQRCPKGEHAMNKPNAPAKKTNGCGNKDWSDKILPGADRLRQCCNGDDICFGTCDRQFVDCYKDFAVCMYKVCEPKSRLKKLVCYTERMVYLWAVQGKTALKGWRISGEKRCDCVRSVEVGP